jgi:hypothetical protein
MPLDQVGKNSLAKGGSHVTGGANIPGTINSGPGTGIFSPKNSTKRQSTQVKWGTQFGSGGVATMGLTGNTFT